MPVNVPTFLCAVRLPLQVSVVLSTECVKILISDM
nr:MAG TPA: hypothetical protein [Caudoviricetes sp.]